ncbi:MAG: glutathione S-transferase family protein [Pseudomonadota bacterium]
MSILVYSVSGAPRPWRALLGLAFKGLTYETRILKASEGEHKAAPYLSVNPRGTVPTLVEGDTVMRDSIAALAWLDRAYPDRPLFGESAEEAAYIWQRTTEFADYLRDACHGVLAPIFFHGANAATPELVAAAETLRAEFAGLEKLLGQAPFLSGDRAGAADAVAFPEVRLIQRAVETHTALMTDLGLGSFSQDYPGLANWKGRIEALAGVAKTFPPHWKEAA